VLPYGGPPEGVVAFFLGKYTHTLDDKNRVALPAKFRDELVGETNQVVAVFIGFSRCITVYPKKAAEDFMAYLEGKQFESKEKAAAFKRLLTSTASLVSMDDQGRITLTEEQRQWAGLSKKVVILGHSERIEIWDPDRFGQEVGKVDMEALSELAGEFFNESPNKKS
jgi:MraZ protein